MPPESTQRIKDWLSPTESDSPASEYRKHLNSHAEGTGEWIFETEQYRQWSQSSVGNLWIRGIPGCGKSVVAANLIRRFRRAKDGPVLFFFFREIIQTNRTPRSLVQDFCHEMFEYSPSLQSQLNQLKEQHSSVESVPYEKLWKCMSSAMSAVGKVHCVVDALDEMEQGNDQFFKDLLDLGRQSGGSIKLIMTSRQVPHVEKHLNGTSVVDLRLDRLNVDRDITLYIAQRLDEANLNISQDKIDSAKKAICERGQGLFLYSRLMLDQLLLDPESMVSKVENLPNGLGDMYTEILRDHATRSGTPTSFQQFILQWITHSARPLRLLELAVMVDSLPDRGGLSQDQDTKLAIRTTCGPLLELCEDGVLQIIHHSLTEFALNRDVAHTQIFNHERDFSGFHSPTVHAMITRTCINYLSNGCLDQHRPLCSNTRDNYDQWRRDNKELMLRFYFLRYAISEWPFHASKAAGSDELMHLLDNFCQDSNQSYMAWKSLWSDSDRDAPGEGSSLHVATYCGIPAFASYLIGNGVDLDTRDAKNETPLMFAVSKNRHAIITLLLHHGANPSKSREKDLVLYAADLNHAESLRALILGGAELKTTLSDVFEQKESFWCDTLNEVAKYRTLPKMTNPLERACYEGNTECVQELMKHLDPSYLCKGFLHIASKWGKSKTVTALLENEKVRLAINDHDSEGNTPLYLAAKRRDFATIKALLDHGADINAMSMNLSYPPEPPHDWAKYPSGPQPSYSPLHGLALGFAHHWWSPPMRSNWVESLELLLRAGCDIDTRDYLGRTPLFWWSEFPAFSQSTESMDFVSALIDRGADASLLDFKGLSPLHVGLRQLTSKIAELLVNGGADINTPRISDGMTPLMSMSPQLTREELVLWRDKNGNFSQKDCAGSTAFHHCFRSRVSAVNKNDTVPWINTWFDVADINARNHAGRTPLLEILFRTNAWSLEISHNTEVVRAFVKNGASMEARDTFGRTALLVALSHPKLETFYLVDEILALGGDVKAVDNEGRSALHYAFRVYKRFYSVDRQSGRISISKMIELGANVDAKDYQGNTIPHELLGVDSSYKTWEEVEPSVKLMIEMGVPLHAVNHQGQTVLHLAARDAKTAQRNENCSGNALRFLLGPPASLEVDARDINGRTALHFASATSDVFTSILIQHGADVWAEDHQNRTPLHFAAEAGQSNVVGLLLESYSNEEKSVDGLCDINRSALHVACRAGCQESVQMLLDAGANPRTRDKEGKTPLHAAAEFNFVSSGEMKQPKSDNVVSDSAETTSTLELDDWDAECQKEIPGQLFRDIRQVIALLIAAGAEPHSTDKKGQTASEVAASLGCTAVSDELMQIASGDSTLPTPLFKHQLSSVCNQFDAIKAPEDRTAFFKKVVSTGNGRLFEEILCMNHLRLSGPDGKSIMTYISHWGLASMMKRLIPYVEDFASMISELLETAIRQRSCNLQMLRVLVENITDREDRWIFARSVEHSVQSESWWYPRALSILIDAGASPNSDGHYTPLRDCLWVGVNGESENFILWRDQSLRILLEHGADPNGLGAALECKRDVKILKLLVDHGARISGSVRPLIQALGRKDIDFAAVKFLLDSGADPNGTDSMRPLQYSASQYKSEKAVALLIKYGADVHAPMEDGTSTVLHEICASGGILKPILAAGIDLNPLDAQRRTPLMRACANLRNRLPNVAELIQTNALVDSVDDAGSTALHHAARCGNVKAVKELLGCSVDISLRNSAGFTPLCSALHSFSRYWDVLELHATIEALLDAGADPHDILPDGRGALHCVVGLIMNSSNEDRKQQIEQNRDQDHFGLASGLYRRFIEAGCDPELRDTKGRTPIFDFIAADKSYSGDHIDPEISPVNVDDCREMLAKHDVHKIDYDGESLLHALARREEGECESEDHGSKLFSMLVDMGLDPWKENNMGQTPLDIASTHEQYEILRLFARDE
ncbi:unnamed protein product [Penicillium salamii]|uniref:Nephrocystin 3-like N-terminal domain-containing protein n=1 Tax=Penicillium salamii TaxID=1612424 RepID=A0A9W4IIM0_9EURO|nr:unnamed protein product [Penicillium salamii]CAG8085565.1 unnamed protein product [Penicillium salamii]CAG8102690.1 unnamed protein product [Penicillium salamii]CAG8103709.1 unnamed protein product [Penicillium salamii]CAG8118840.1 unnamed protein product [Penicillium salamii]